MLHSWLDYINYFYGRLLHILTKEGWLLQCSENSIRKDSSCTLYNALCLPLLWVSLWLDCLHKGPWFGHVDAWKIIFLRKYCFSNSLFVWAEHVISFLCNFIIRERYPHDLLNIHIYMCLYIYISMKVYMFVGIVPNQYLFIHIYTICQIYLITDYVILIIYD